ncbi:MAG: hypothetical protein OEY98_09365 [Acidimicrobiia bacterium]|nr:hypothetical protein [Acidimicrobiia bacterium]
MTSTMSDAGAVDGALISVAIMATTTASPTTLPLVALAVEFMVYPLASRFGMFYFIVTQGGFLSNQPGQF